jgi:hypothetical protein
MSMLGDAAELFHETIKIAAGQAASFVHGEGQTQIIAEVMARLHKEEAAAPMGFGGTHHVLVLRIDPADYIEDAMQAGASVTFQGEGYTVSEVRPAYNYGARELVLRRGSE